MQPSCRHGVTRGEQIPPAPGSPPQCPARGARRRRDGSVWPPPCQLRPRSRSCPTPFPHLPNARAITAIWLSTVLPVQGTRLPNHGPERSAAQIGTWTWPGCSGGASRSSSSSTTPGCKSLHSLHHHTPRFAYAARPGLQIPAAGRPSRSRLQTTSTPPCCVLAPTPTRHSAAQVSAGARACSPVTPTSARAPILQGAENEHLPP